MKVRDLMVPKVIACTDQASLGEAVRLMWEHDIGFVPVLSAQTQALAGVITDRDACMAEWFQGKPLGEIPVRTAMSTRVLTYSEDAEVDEAQLTMIEFQVHRLVVMSASGKPCGVISINDLARRAVKDADADLEAEVALTLGAITTPRQVGA